MRSEGIAGMTGRGYLNLYRSVSYRTAGGSFVRSREIDMGVLTFTNYPILYSDRKKSSKMKYMVTADFG